MARRRASARAPDPRSGEQSACTHVPLPDVPPTLRPVGDESGWTVIVDWRDGSPADAHGALQAALRDCGIEADSVPSEDIRINYGSYRGDAPQLGYFRVSVRRSVLSAD